MVNRQNIVKKIVYVVVAIVALLACVYLYSNYYTKGKIIIKADNTEIIIKNKYGKIVLNGSGKIESRLAPGDYFAEVLHANGNTLSNFIIEPRKTVNYSPNLQNQSQSQPVFKSDSSFFVANNDELQTITYDNFLTQFTDKSMQKIVNNTEELYLYDLNRGYIKKSDGLYYVNGTDIIKINLPENIKESFNISYSKDGNYVIWNNNYIYLLVAGNFEPFLETKDSSINNISVYDRGLYYVSKKQNNQKIETIVTNILFDKKEISKTGFIEDVINYSSGEEGQDRPNNNISTYPSQNGENLVLQNNDLSYIYDNNLKTINSMPVKFIKNIKWRSADELYFSDGDSLYKYSLKSKEALLITKSMFVKNITNILLSNNKIYYSSYLDGTEQAIFRVNENINDSSNKAIKIFPKFYINCTINFVNINNNNLLLSKINEECADKAEANLITNGIDISNFGISQQ